MGQWTTIGIEHNQRRVYQMQETGIVTKKPSQ